MPGTQEQPDAIVERVPAMIDYPLSTRQPAEVTVGVVWSELIAQIGSPPVMVNRAHFAPGARTCWHEHARGQLLIVEQGVALVQEFDGPVTAVGAGQTIVCDPGVRHWHGAAPHSTMTQFAVTPATADGEYAVWGDQVTDEEYGRWDLQHR
jgi:quercetin dioxygenase-like cupin family protein